MANALMKCCADRHEAAQLPAVVTSSIDPRSYDAQRTQWAPSAEGDIPQAPPFTRPSDQWVVQMLHDFAGVRADMQR
jgi:Survival motor neuron (SMN) interacting protein 1 (SIP1)